ncbi:Neur-chan-LBD domain-containing protein [Aphelenchoides besseyi]|nr:Neur-chan-LBD domain-containing protein [Aphelenchoides besseyi]
MVRWLLVFFFLFLSALAMNSRSNSTGMSTTSMLMNELFANYDRRIRPFAEEHRPVQVHMSIVLGILIDIRENEQIACYVISHVQRWTDLRLKWRPREWNGTKELIAPLSNIWLPRIFVYNSMVTTDMLPPEKYDVRIKHTGEIKINIPQYLEAICELINVTARHMTFKEEEEVRAEVHYIFLFKRRAIFYIAVIVIPIMLISALSLMGIFSIVSDNEARNDKAGLGLSSLLSLSVILGILSDALPRTNSLPLLGIYILCVIIICALAVCLSLILSTLSRKLVEQSVMQLLYFLLLSTVQSINGMFMNNQNDRSKQFLANPSELLDRLLSKYDKRVRPFADEQKPVTIQMTIVLSILTELRENEQTASFVVSVSCCIVNFTSFRDFPHTKSQRNWMIMFGKSYWVRENRQDFQRYTDERLQWNPDENQGLKQLVVPVSLLWIPKLFIYNSVETKDMLTSERFDARVQHTGEVYQTEFLGQYSIIDQNQFATDGEYRVEVHYIMHLHRRPVYYLTVVVAPCFLISSLSILGVFSPTDDNSPRGERVSLGLGSLLALVRYFIIAIILLCASAVAVSTLLLGLNRKLIDSHKMPSNIAYTIALLRAPKKPRDYWQAGLNNMDYFDGLTVTPPKFPDLAALFNRVQEIAQTQIEFRKMQQKKEMIEKEWNRVFSRIDYLLLFIFEALNLLILILFLRQSWIPVPELPSDFSV